MICKHKPTGNIRAYVWAPLYAQSDILGLLYLDWENPENNQLINAEINQDLLIGMIAEQTPLGISNIELRETLRNQSFRDALTNLFNRRYLEETLEREISRCARKSVSMALLMIDIDNFKQFNDKFGHEAGDIVIQAFANVLHQFARKEDIACRYGGEEFILIVPEVELDAVLMRIQSLRQVASHIHVRYGSTALPPITVSIGVAMYPDHGETMNELITAADKALYEAKNSGRDKTIVHQN